MQEVRLKTHLIIRDTHHEYNMNWCGKFAAARPLLLDGKPLFIIIGSRGRIETSDFDMKKLEETAKLLTHPKGRGAISVDTARIYLREVDGNDLLLGVMTHRFIRDFAPVFDGFKCC